MARKSKLMKNNIDIPKKKKAKKKNNTGADSTSAQNEKFNFDNEIVIGVNIIPDTKKDKPSKKGKKKKKKKIKEKKDNTINSKHIDISTNNNKKNNNTNDNVVHIQKQKKSTKKLKLVVKIILIIALIIGIAIFIMTTSLFNVTHIEVSGNYRVAKQRIESLSKINLDVNTYQYSKKEIASNIKEEPYVENVKVKRILPNTIKIEIEERKPKYIILYSNSYVYISNYGYILEISNEALSIPLIEGYTTTKEKIVPGNRLQSEDLQKLNTVLKITESMETNEISDKITSIDISDKNNYIIKMENEGKIVYLGNASNINDRILMLKEILIKEANFKGGIFMQDLNKIYFRQEG